MMQMWRRLVARIRYRRFDADLAEELRFHEEMKRQELERDGASAADARARARRALGNVTLAREDARRVWIAPWLESIAQDVRYAVRSLARQPAYAVTAGVTLVLGIGLNTSLFSVVKGVMLDPWPVNNPGEVVRIAASKDGRTIAPSVEEFRFLREHARSFTGLAANTWAGLGGRLRAPGRPEQYLRPVWVSANFFDVLGVRLAMGTGFVPEDDQPGNGRAPLIVGHRLWRTYFGADPAVIGLPVFVGGVPFTIIGVLEPRFDGIGRPVDLWMPLSSFSSVRSSDRIAWEPGLKATQCCVQVVGRLAPGVNVQRATDELQRLHEQFAADRHQPAGRVEMIGTSPIAGRPLQALALLGTLAGALLLILVLACANVGNLQLARGLARRREIATRMAIGAGRGRIVRQLFTEALVLSCGAGLVALGVASVLPAVLFRALGEDVPPNLEARAVPDFEVALFTLGVCVVACIVFAVLPARHATRVTIPLGALDRTGTPARLRLRGALLAVQIAACTILLVAAGLITRAIGHAMTFDPGFRVDGVTLITAQLPRDGYVFKQHREFARQVLQELERSADAPVALAGYAPFDGSSLVMSVGFAGEGPGARRSVDLRQVSRDYFKVLGIPLMAGRMYESFTPNEAVVNEAFVRTYFPDRHVLGTIVRDVGDGTRDRATFTIVGVVRDAYLGDIEKLEPIIFTPAATGIFLTAGGPATVERIRTVALTTSPAAMFAVRPLRDALSDQLEDARNGARLAWAIGVLGLLLAIVGVFGVFAYAVEERRREIGVRLALGAAKSDIVRMLVSTSGRAMAIGLVIGLFASLACGPVLRSYLYGLHPLDPAAYALVMTMLAAAAVLATFIPARRALRTDPAVTLRAE